MKYINNKISWLLIVAIVFALIINSCKEDEELGSADRLFRPVINETSYGGTWIRLVWDKYASANSYDLQLSIDSFITLVSEVSTDTTFYQFNELEYDTDYLIRIKSIGESLESKYFINDIIRTSDYPTKLNSISDITDTEVKVTWEEASYDSLLVMRDDTVDVSHIVTDAENAKKEAIITGLLSDTAYVVRAYAGGKYQGKKSFSTSAPQVFEGEIIDLRSYSVEESYALLNQDFFDNLALTYPNGVTVILAGGTSYELDGPTVSSPFNLITGYSVRGDAIIEVKGNFDVDGSAVIDKISLEGISFTDHPDKPKTDGNYGGTYLFNISNSGASIDSVIIEDCDIRYKRGIMRIKTGAAVKAISINNCFIDSISGYGVVNLDNGGVITNSISVTNSTIAHTELFLRSDKMDQDLQNLTISNITTYYTPKDYFFRMGNISEVEITNCLFGAVWDSEGGAEGLSSGDITTSKIQDNYRTSDCVWTPVVDESGAVTGEKNPIESTQMSESSEDVFTDPSSSNYSLMDSDLANRIGDPRWW